MTPFIDADAVAGLIGFSTGRAFLAARFRLETQEHFPLPMPTCQRPMKWRRDAVTAWREERGLPAATAPVIHAGSNVILMREARRA